MGRAFLAMVCGLALWACHEQVSLPDLDLDPAQSLLLVQTDDLGTTVQALDLSESNPEPAWLVHGEAEVYLMSYACPVPRLGLQPGLQPETAIPTDRLYLPQPLYERQLQTSAASEGWQTPSQRPERVQEALHRLPLSHDVACEASTAQLERVEVSLPNDGHRTPAFALSMGDDTALLASSDGFYYLVLPTGQVKSLPRTLPMAPRAAHRMADGELWILDAQGVLHRGDLERGFEVVDRFGPVLGDAVAVMTGPQQAGAPMELFLATSQQAFVRYDGAEWTTWATAGPLELLPPTVLWLGPGHAMSAGYNREVLEYVDSGLRRTRLPDGDFPVGLAELPGLGLLVGSAGGPVYLKQGETWVLHGRPGFEAASYLLAPLPVRGLLVGGLVQARGFKFGFTQWLPELGYCPAEVLSDPAVAVVPVDAQTYVLVTITSLTTRQSFDIDMIRLGTLPATCSGP